MRILHVADSYLPKIGGIEAMVSQLAARQTAAGHEVRVLTKAEGPDMTGVVRDGHRLDELVGWAEMVHVHLSLISPLAYRAACTAARHGRPTLASVHSMWTGGEQVVGLGGLALGWGRLPICWAPVSHAAAASVRRALGSRARIEILPNAIELDDWRVRPVVHREVRVVTTGRMAPRKRPLAALEMIERARELTCPEIELKAVMVGEGPLREALERRVRRRGLDWVEVPGPLTRPSLLELYASSDIFLAPAKLESFGLAALEARLAGLAVLARRGTGVVDFIEDGRHGLISSSDAQMAEHLAQLASRPAQLDRIKKTNRDEIPDLGWNRLGERLDVLYRQAAELQGIGRLEWTPGPSAGAAPEPVPAVVA